MASRTIKAASASQIGSVRVPAPCSTAAPTPATRASSSPPAILSRMFCHLLDFGDHTLLNFLVVFLNSPFAPRDSGGNKGEDGDQGDPIAR